MIPAVPGHGECTGLTTVVELLGLLSGDMTYSGGVIVEMVCGGDIVFTPTLLYAKVSFGNVWNAIYLGGQKMFHHYRAEGAITFSITYPLCGCDWSSALREGS